MEAIRWLSDALVSIAMKGSLVSINTQPALIVVDMSSSDPEEVLNIPINTEKWGSIKQHRIQQFWGRTFLTFCTGKGVGIKEIDKNYLNEDDSRKGECDYWRLVCDPQELGSLEDGCIVEHEGKQYWLVIQARGSGSDRRYFRGLMEQSSPSYFDFKDLTRIGCVDRQRQKGTYDVVAILQEGGWILLKSQTSELRVINGIRPDFGDQGLEITKFEAGEPVSYLEFRIPSYLELKRNQSKVNNYKGDTVKLIFAACATTSTAVETNGDQVRLWHCLRLPKTLDLLNGTHNNEKKSVKALRERFDP